MARAEWAALVAVAVFVAELVAVEAAVPGLGLGFDGDVHPAIASGATMSTSVMSKRYRFTFFTPEIAKTH